MKRRTDNGHDLLNEIESTVADIVARADERRGDIECRLRELEAEVTALGKVKIIAGA